MKNTQKLLLGLAAVAAIYAFSAEASCAGTVTAKEKIITQTSYTVGTRRVGMVGGRPYPLIISQTDTHTVKTSKHQGVKATTETSTSTVVSGTEPFSYASEGGTYYTSGGAPYYPNGELNIHVVNTGAFND